MWNEKKTIVKYFSKCFLNIKKFLYFLITNILLYNKTNWFINLWFVLGRPGKLSDSESESDFKNTAWGSKTNFDQIFH